MSHYFYALVLPDEVKRALNELTELLHLPFKKWVHPDDYHITLAFLGAADSQPLEQTIRNVEKDFANIHAFPLTINRFGTFGRRIFWAGVEESQELHYLQQTTFRHCTAAGFQLDQRPFTPHITIARQWQGEELLDISRLLPLHLHFIANEVALYQTHLDRIPKYVKVESFVLAST